MSQPPYSLFLFPGPRTFFGPPPAVLCVLLLPGTKCIDLYKHWKLCVSNMRTGGVLVGSGLAQGAVCDPAAEGLWTPGRHRT